MPRGTGPTPVLVTCEHGGNRIPAPYRRIFAGAGDVLASHRGWDPGALSLSRTLAPALGGRRRTATLTRLLVDLNRSPGHPRVFSEFTRGLPREEREEILERWHAPHRERVVADVGELAVSAWPVVHLGVHSFTPVLDGVVRRADVALLYDPSRPGEAALCSAWARELRRLLPDLAVRRNQPYRGVSDGLTTWLRRQFGAEAYVGAEIEVNQRLLGADGGFPGRIADALAAGFLSAGGAA
jgi:predicted N-formylglutamate amidohydrolase